MARIPGRNRNPKVIANLETEQLRNPAFAHLRRQLGEGKRLGTALDERVRATKGAMAALCPIQTAEKGLADFEVGQVPAGSGPPQWVAIGDLSGFAYPKETARRELAELISRELEVHNGVCLLENPLARRGDAWLRRARSHVLTCGDDVYHLLTHDHRAIMVVETALREAEYIPGFLGGCGHQLGPFSAPPPHFSTISSDDIYSFASSATSAFVSAYDGEGYLAWKLVE